MAKPTDTPPDQAVLDRVIYAIFMDLLESDTFSDLVETHCLKVTGVSNPVMRSIVREAFKTKVGI